jgi:hypothetical protein
MNLSLQIATSEFNAQAIFCAGFPQCAQFPVICRYTVVSKNRKRPL